jgi:hypothetical protein
MAYAGFLRKGRRALSLCEGNGVEETILGSLSRRTLADRLATHESLRKHKCRFHLTHPLFLLDDCDAWTLNASLTRLSSYRKCSKRRILGHSAQATSLLPIEGTTKCSHIARGLGFGNGTGFAAEVNPKAGFGFRTSAALRRTAGNLFLGF